MKAAPRELDHLKSNHLQIDCTCLSMILTIRRERVFTEFSFFLHHIRDANRIICGKVHICVKDFHEAVEKNWRCCGFTLHPQFFFSSYYVDKILNSIDNLLCGLTQNWLLSLVYDPADSYMSQFWVTFLNENIKGVGSGAGGTWWTNFSWKKTIFEKN